MAPGHTGTEQLHHAVLQPRYAVLDDGQQRLLERAAVALDEAAAVQVADVLELGGPAG